MDNGINKQDLLNKISELIFEKHQKIDDANVVASETKAHAEGYIEALYHIENILIKWEK